MINNKKKLNFKKRRCELCDSKITYVDYKDVKFLEKFVTNTGQIKPSASTGNCAKDQRKVANAIKRARFMALLPYVKERVRNNK
ncbi:MAG: 30S ribosomal protein S18 [Metamycoplasmataceae bacterium]|uniref:30S ribosomal protein S18 n=1 Tax=Mycoplasmopsis lipophila TaxID=2117 RepID=UPI003873A454